MKRNARKSEAGGCDTTAARDGETFSARMERLEKIVERLEGDDVGLEEALAAFEEGVKLSRALSESLSGAEKKIEILLRQPDGTVAIEPFDPGLDDADLHEGHETDDDDT